MDQPESRRGSISVEEKHVNNTKLPPSTVKGEAGREKASRLKMADPFEVRMRFTSQLQHLNASVTSSQKAANYALRYKDMDEDLHSCILEQLEKNNMNVRANIMYFIEHFCEMAHRDGHEDYVRMMQRDILQVVDSVTPEDGSGAANIKVVRKVLRALNAKNFLSNQTLEELEECLQCRGNETTTDPLPTQLNTSTSTTSKNRPSSLTTNANLAPRLDKKQIEQRIEEDRERHKRARESIWAIPFSNSNSYPVIPAVQNPSAENGENKSIRWDYDPEFEKLWDETSELGEDDYDLFEEEFQERRKAAKTSGEDYRSLGPSGGFSS